MPADNWKPRQVLLFSGHLVDAPDRATPRFPPEKVAAAADRLAAALDRIGAGSDDLSFSQAAAGGDLLFLEACQQRGVHTRVLLPFAEHEFIEQSILPVSGGEAWRDRYVAMKARLEPGAIRIMTEELGTLPADINPFERCNVWLLDSALASGADSVHFLCVWNGAGGDGPGGTEHMYNEVKRLTGRVTWIDTRTL
jgi:hypothetical protein